jgi:putative alpha-1,2-mannosidase
MPSRVRRGVPLAAAAALLLAAAAPARADLAGFVNPLSGTAGLGMTFPGASVPFGMIQSSPDTEPGRFANGGYRYEDSEIRGFSLVHLSGPGVPKAGDLPFMPGPGPARFSHANEVAEPGYYRVALDSGVTVDTTASTRAAMQRYAFPSPQAAYVRADVRRGVAGARGGSVRQTGPAELSGWTRSTYPVYFDARFSTTIHGFSGGVAHFRAPVVTMRVGISFVSVAGARGNLAREAPSFDFDRMRANARAAWNRELGLVQVEGGDPATFYTALYHALLQPHVYSDADGSYRGFDRRVHRVRGRAQYSDLPLWDTEKSGNQLLALLEPRRYRDTLLSLLADYRERGKLPRWAEKNTDPAYMEGDPALPAIADGVCRGLVPRSAAGELYGAGVKLRSRRGHPARTSTALEYAVDDLALALAGDALGLHRDARRLAAASLAYRSFVDPATRWLRPLGPARPFDPVSDAGFLEGSSYQYSWLAPQDARGVFDRMGGDAVAVQRLDALFAVPVSGDDPSAPPGHRYDGRGYAVGNEQDLQVPWMYAFAGRRPDALAGLRRWFTTSPGGLPGNDDLGALSSWYVFNSLGFGPVTPGAPFYVLGPPAFSRATIAPRGGRPFTVVPQPSGLWAYERDLRAGRAQPSRPPSLSDSLLRRFGCRA